MVHGFLRVAVASPKLTLADCGENTANILSLIKKADDEQSNIIVFPELSITGATCGELFNQELLTRIAMTAVKLIAEKTSKLDILIVIGFPFAYLSSIYNCAAVIQNGEILGIIPKQINNNKNQDRFFSTPPKSLTLIEKDVFNSEEIPFGNNLLFMDKRDASLSLAINIISDYHSLALTSNLKFTGAVCSAYLAAIPENINSLTLKRNVLKANSYKNMEASLFANAGLGESTSDFVYSGHCLIGEGGKILTETKPFTSQLCITEIDIQKLLFERRNQKIKAKNSSFVKIPVNLNNKASSLENFTRKINPLPFVSKIVEKENLSLKLNKKTSFDFTKSKHSQFAWIIELQAESLKQRLLHTKINKVVLGISGGLDSSLALLAIVRCFDCLEISRENIIAITMPGLGTSTATKRNALKLAKSLEVSTKEISIVGAVNQHLKAIGHDGVSKDITYENAQARERTQVLMDIANMENALVVGSGNLSELALGWTTYNGDLSSMYAINASLPKTLIIKLISWAKDNPSLFVQNETRIKRNFTQSLKSILETPISPELIPANNNEEMQKTEDIVGPYILHDFFIYHVLRWGSSPSKVLFLAEQAFSNNLDEEINFSKEEILHWLKVFCSRFFANQFKRSSLPEGPSLGLSFFPRQSWIMPSDASLAIWKKELNLL